MARIGLVLGAGGEVGHAFHAGVLAAIEAETGWDPRSAEIVVGTSAGSFVGAFLRAGIAAGDLAAWGKRLEVSEASLSLIERAEAAWERFEFETEDSERRSTPPNPLLAVRAMLPPWEISPGAVASGLIPAGSRSTEHLAAGLRDLFDSAWPDAPLWICAVRVGDGRRVVFGSARAPETDVPTAVAASCAVPRVFAPVAIGDASFLDGGVHSPTNLDVVADADLDLVVVSSPMSAVARSWSSPLRAPMRRVTRLALGVEAKRVRDSGTPVLAFQPTKADLEHMSLLKRPDASRRRRIIEAADGSAHARLARDDASDAVALLRSS